MCQRIVSVHCESFRIFNTAKRLSSVRRWRRVSTVPAGWLCCHLRQADDNARPLPPQLCDQYANECSWRVKLDKPQHAPRARLHCELVLELPKIKLCWLTPQSPFKMRPRREGNGLWKATNQAPRPLAQVRVRDCFVASGSSWIVAWTLSAPSTTLLIRARPWPPLQPAGSH